MSIGEQIWWVLLGFWVAATVTAFVGVFAEIFERLKVIEELLRKDLQP